MSGNVRPRCFLDLEIASKPVGRIIIELYSDNSPKTCENFRCLCTGEKGNGEISGKPLHYQGVIFHRIIKGFMIQSGDFVNGNGTGGESIYGATFEDESYGLKHDRPYLLSMANRGKDTNASQFFILTAPAPHLDGKHVVFGEVIKGIEVVNAIESVETDSKSRPVEAVQVINCGELVLQQKKKKHNKRERSASSNDKDAPEEGQVVEGEAESSDNSASGNRKHKKRSKKQKKEKKHHKDKSLQEKADQPKEEAFFSTVRADELPEEPKNYFLLRHDKPKAEESGETNARVKTESKVAKSEEQLQKSRFERPGFGQRRYNERPRYDPAGRKVKGRGVLRFRKPPRSRSRSYTPPHWREAQSRIISINDKEALEKAAERWQRGDMLREMESQNAAAKPDENGDALPERKGPKSYVERKRVSDLEPDQAKRSSRHGDRDRKASEGQDGPKSLSDRFVEQGTSSKVEEVADTRTARLRGLSNEKRRRSSSSDKVGVRDRGISSPTSNRTATYSPMKMLAQTLQSKKNAPRIMPRDKSGDSHTDKQSSGSPEVRQRRRLSESPRQSRKLQQSGSGPSLKARDENTREVISAEKPAGRSSRSSSRSSSSVHHSTASSPRPPSAQASGNQKTGPQSSVNQLKGKNSKSPTNKKRTIKHSSSPDNKRSETKNSMSLDGKRPTTRGSSSPDKRRPTRRNVSSPDKRRPTRRDTSSPDKRRPTRRDTSSPDNRRPRRDSSSPDKRRPRRDSSSPDKRRPRRDSSSPDKRRPTRRDSRSPDTRRPTKRDLRSPDKRRPTRRDSSSPDKRKPARKDVSPPDKRRPTRRDSSSPDNQQQTRKGSCSPDGKRLTSRDSRSPDNKCPAKKVSSSPDNQHATGKDLCSPNDKHSAKRDSSSHTEKDPASKHSSPSDSKHPSREDSCLQSIKPSPRKDSSSPDNASYEGNAMPDPLSSSLSVPEHPTEPSTMPSAEVHTEKQVSMSSSPRGTEEKSRSEVVGEPSTKATASSPVKSNRREEDAKGRRSNPHTKEEPAAYRLTSNDRRRSTNERRGRSRSRERRRSRSIDRRRRSGSRSRGKVSPRYGKRGSYFQRSGVNRSNRRSRSRSSRRSRSKSRQRGARSPYNRRNRDLGHRRSKDRRSRSKGKRSSSKDRRPVDPWQRKPRATRRSTSKSGSDKRKHRSRSSSSSQSSSSRGASRSSKSSSTSSSRS